MGASVGRNAASFRVNDAGGQPKTEMGLGSRAALMLNMRLALLLVVLIVGREIVMLVNVVAKGKLLG